MEKKKKKGFSILNQEIKEKKLKKVLIFIFLDNLKREEREEVSEKQNSTECSLQQ